MFFLFLSWSLILICCVLLLMSLGLCWSGSVFLMSSCGVSFFIVSMMVLMVCCSCWYFFLVFLICFFLWVCILGGCICWLMSFGSCLGNWLFIFGNSLLVLLLL